ncbi:MAG: PaaI family thioesterase [Gemmatimonadales bacterium]
MSPPSPDLTPEQKREVLDLWNNHPGMRHLGATVQITDTGDILATIDPIQDFHRGGLGTDAVNGAVIAGVFDMVIGLTGFLHVVGRRAGVAQLNVHFLRPVHGSRLEVLGRPKRLGRTLVFVESELRDGQGQLCATCDGILAVSGGYSAPVDQVAL